MNTPEHATKRPAWRTSAFWIALLAMLLPLAESLLKLMPQNGAAYIAGSALVAAGFTVSRNLVYKSRNDASAAVEVAKLAAPDVGNTTALVSNLFNQLVGAYISDQSTKLGYVPVSAQSTDFAVNLKGMSGANSAGYVDLTPPGVPLESE